MDGPAKHPPDPREWKRALLCFAGGNLLNTVIATLWIPLRWGGSTWYEAGGEATQNMPLTYVLRGLFAVAFTVNFGGFLLYALKRRWKLAGGFAMAWLTLPAAVVVGLAAYFIISLALF